MKRKKNEKKGIMRKECKKWIEEKWIKRMNEWNGQRKKAIKKRERKENEGMNEGSEKKIKWKRKNPQKERKNKI